MKTNLLNCVEALRDVRRSLQDDAEPSIVAALSEAIAELERSVKNDDLTKPELAEAAFKALAVIGDVLVCINGIAELIHHFRA